MEEKTLISKTSSVFPSIAFTMTYSVYQPQTGIAHVYTDYFAAEAKKREFAIAERTNEEWNKVYGLNGSAYKSYSSSSSYSSSYSSTGTNKTPKWVPWVCCGLGLFVLAVPFVLLGILLLIL